MTSPQEADGTLATRLEKHLGRLAATKQAGLTKPAKKGGLTPGRASVGKKDKKVAVAPGPRPNKTTHASPEDPCVTVGLISESEVAHRERRAKAKVQGCPRCIYYTRNTTWEITP